MTPNDALRNRPFKQQLIDIAVALTLLAFDIAFILFLLF